MPPDTITTPNSSTPPVSMSGVLSSVGNSAPQGSGTPTAPVTPPVPTPASSNSSGLDQSIQNMAMAIQQQESEGNYQDVGDAGTSMGAYQWQPGTWAKESQKYLGANAPATPLQATPTQQNQVAYDQIKSWKNAGFTDPQIASMWNAGEGEPNAYTGQFSNGSPSATDKFDVPGYVKNVFDNYQNLSNGQPMITGKGGSTSVDTTSANAPSTQGMSTWDKIRYGVGIPALIAATAFIAPELIPEEAEAEAAGLAGSTAATGATGAASDLGGVAGEGFQSDINAPFDSATSQGANVGGDPTAQPQSTAQKWGSAAKNFVKQSIPADIAGGIGLVNGLFGGGKKQANAETAAGDEEASATEGAGATEANATASAATSEEETQEDIADEAAAQSTLAQKQAATAAYNQQMKQTAAGTKISQTADGQQGIDELTTQGIQPGINDEGKFETQEAQQAMGQVASDIDEQEQEIHSASGDTGDLEDLRVEAKQAVRRDNRIPSTEWDSADKMIDEQINGYQKRMGNNPTLGRGGIGQIRSDGYKSFDKNASNAKNAVGRAMGSAANKHMLDKSSSKELIAEIHKKKQATINARKVLKHLDGKKALGKPGVMQKILHGIGEYAGVYIGDKMGGVTGAILGDIVGKNIIKQVDKRYGKNIFEQKGVKKALQMLKGSDSKIYDKITKKLTQYGIKSDQSKKEASQKAEKEKWNMPGESDISKKSKEDRMNKKRGEYQSAKSKVMENSSIKKGEYEPYTTPGIIKMGKTPIPKNKKSNKDLPNIKF